jgi:hypothetical protein
MSVVQIKIWSDLWHNKSRTLQVVLIVAMGAFAIGMIVGSSDLMRTQLTQIWRDASPSMINLATDPAIDDETIETLRHIPGVADVEGALETSIEWRQAAGEPWQTATLLARADYTEQTFAKLALKSGSWPERKRQNLQRAGGGSHLQPAGQPARLWRQRRILHHPRALRAAYRRPQLQPRLRRHPPL